MFALMEYPEIFSDYQEEIVSFFHPELPPIFDDEEEPNLSLVMPSKGSSLGTSQRGPREDVSIACSRPRILPLLNYQILGVNLIVWEGIIHETFTPHLHYYMFSKIHVKIGRIDSVLYMYLRRNDVMWMNLCKFVHMVFVVEVHMRPKEFLKVFDPGGGWISPSLFEFRLGLMLLKDYSVHALFNVEDFSPYLDDDGVAELRSIPFKGGGDDAILDSMEDDVNLDLGSVQGPGVARGMEALFGSSTSKAVGLLTILGVQDNV